MIFENRGAPITSGAVRIAKLGRRMCHELFAALK